MIKYSSLRQLGRDVHARGNSAKGKIHPRGLPRDGKEDMMDLLYTSTNAIDMLVRGSSTIDCLRNEITTIVGLVLGFLNDGPKKMKYNGLSLKVAEEAIEIGDGSSQRYWQVHFTEMANPRRWVAYFAYTGEYPPTKGHDRGLQIPSTIVCEVHSNLIAIINAVAQHFPGLGPHLKTYEEATEYPKGHLPQPIV